MMYFTATVARTVANFRLSSDGGDGGDKDDGGDREDRGDGEDCVGAGFTTIFLVAASPN